MIPKKIHYCWFGGNPLPESAQKCIKSWRKFCPDYEIIEWNEKNFDVSSAPLYVRQAYEAKKWAFVSDYARLDIIYQRGGIYLDTDVEIIKSFDELLINRGFAGFESSEYVALGLGFGAEPRNPVVGILRDRYLQLEFIKSDGTYDFTPIPVINTKDLEKLGLVKNGQKQIVDDCFTVYPMDYFCPKSFVDGVITLTQNTYSIHHFDASWLTDEQQRDLRNRWKEKQIKIKKKARRAKIKSVLTKIMGEKLYKKIRG